MKKKYKLPVVEIVAESHSDDIESNVLYLTPEEKAAFYEEIFLLYMEHLKEEDPDRWGAIQNMVELLSAKPHYGMVLYMFKRVAPTFCDTKPIAFLKDAISLSNQFFKQFDMLCVFMQIAAFRWALIEKSIKQTAKARVGRQSHVKQTLEKDAAFAETFEKIQNDKGNFSAYYEDLIIDTLVENPEILEKTLKSFRSEHKRKTKSDIELRKAIDNILGMSEEDENFKTNIKSALLLIKPLEKRFRDKCRRFCGHRKEYEIIHFDSIGKSFLLSEIREIWWQQLPPWPIEECSEKLSPHALQCKKMVLQESIYLAKS